MIHGKDILIYEGSTPTPIAAAKSCTISTDADTKETSSPDSGTAKTFVAGRTSWNVSVSMLVLAVKDNLLRVGQTYTLTMGVRGSETDRLTGTAICTQCQITGTVGNLAQGSIAFLGSGDLT